MNGQVIRLGKRKNNRVERMSELLDNFEELRGDLFKMFILAYINPNFMGLDDIKSQEMFDLVTTWKQEFWDLLPRETHSVEFEWYISWQNLHEIETGEMDAILTMDNGRFPDEVPVYRKVKITILED